MVLKRFEPILPYVFAIIITAILTFVLVWSRSIVPVNPFLLLWFAVVGSAWYGGIRAAALSVVVATVSVIYFFLIPEKAISLMQPGPMIEMLLFAVGGLLTGVSIEFFKRTDQEKIFKKKENEYKRRVEEVEKLNAKLQKDVQARDEFMSIVSHELKTPLTSMLLQLQSAVHNIKNVSLANFSVQNLLKMIENVEGQSKRLARMIQDLLNVSLITTGRMDLEREEVDLSELVKEIVERFASRFEREHYQVTVKAKEPVKGSWDRIRLEQVISNLLSNAIRYGDHKPIEIVVEQSGAVAKVKVIDQGIGIPKDQQKKIFERFERGNVSPHEYKGLGVGLYITNQIVKAHKGSISVNSKPGSGTTFTVELPLKQK